jgi:hypothetical protein
MPADSSYSLKKIDTLTLDPIFFFCDININGAEDNVEHIGLIIKKNEIYYKIENDGSSVSVNPINSEELANLNLLDICSLKGIKDDSVNSILFIINEFVESILNDETSLYYIHKIYTGQLDIFNPDSRVSIFPDALPLTCSSFIYYLIKSIFRLEHQFSHIVDFSNWPKYKGLESEIDNIDNIRFSPKNCLHLGITCSKGDFPLNFDLCNKYNFIIP